MVAKFFPKHYTDINAPSTHLEEMAVKKYFLSSDYGCRRWSQFSITVFYWHGRGEWKGIIFSQVAVFAKLISEGAKAQAE